MIIRTDYFIDAVERNDVDRMEDLLKKDIEKHRLHSGHGRFVWGVAVGGGRCRGQGQGKGK